MPKRLQTCPLWRARSDFSCLKAFHFHSTSQCNVVRYLNLRVLSVINRAGAQAHRVVHRITRFQGRMRCPLLNELLLPLQSDWHLLFQFPLLQSPLLQPAAKWEGKKGWKGLGRNTLYVRLQKSYLVWEDFISATDWKINQLQTVYPMIAECFWQCAVIGLDGVIARPQKGNAECVCPWCNPRRSVKPGWPLFSDGYALALFLWY